MIVIVYGDVGMWGYINHTGILCSMCAICTLLSNFLLREEHAPPPIHIGGVRVNLLSS